ncbi:hypothetical protein AB1Y20_015204 [Prymnesium parvum]|uniref:MPN domain-containing protein n=1 Tax=Prymnesium parvum TaxID=97485 RepID=A0AB34K1V1_PRYPA
MDVHPRIRQLRELAETGGREAHFDSHQPVRRGFMAATSLLTQGKTYQAERDIERAYVLKYRFTVFFLERLSMHKDFNLPELKPDRKRLKAACKMVLEELATELEPMLEAIYHAEDAAEAAAEAERAGAASEGDGVLACGECEEPSAHSAVEGELAQTPGNECGAWVERHADPPDDGLDLSRPLYPPRRAAPPPRRAASFEPPPPSFDEVIASSGGYAPPLVAHAAASLPHPPADAAPPTAPPHERAPPAHTPPVESSPPARAPAQSSLFNALLRPATHCPVQPAHVAPPASAPAPSPTYHVPPMDLPALLPSSSRATRSNVAGTMAEPSPRLSGLAGLNLNYQPSACPAAVRSTSADAFSADAARLRTQSFTPPPVAALDLSIPPLRPPASAGAMPHHSRVDGTAGAAGSARASTDPIGQHGSRLAPASAPLGTLGLSGVSGSGLRPVHIPSSVTRDFLRLAQANTARDIETCAILLGQLRQHAFIVERLLVPHQIGSANQCETTNEDEIYSFCTEADLVTLGWIHTHPSQTCFLSSVDLHTHCSWQSMLDEAVAIVLSPRHSPSQGVFRLSHPNPPGLKEVQCCRKSGFHPEHQRNGQEPGNGVYEKCTHVVWREDLDCQIVDLRNK